jgi:hypothetical protein
LRLSVELIGHTREQDFANGEIPGRNMEGCFPVEVIPRANEVSAPPVRRVWVTPKMASLIHAFLPPKKSSSTHVFQSTFAHSSDDTPAGAAYILEIRFRNQLSQ